MNTLAKVLIVMGIVLLAGGLLLLLVPKAPFLGKLPGDIRQEGDGLGFYFPLATCLLLSLVLTLLINLVLWLIRRWGG